MLVLASCVSVPSVDVDADGPRATSALADSLSRYAYFYAFHDGRALVAAREGYPVACHWGYIDTEGHEVIPCQFDRADGFVDGYAQVTLDDRTFYIDVVGDEVPYCIVNENREPELLPKVYSVHVGDKSNPYNDIVTPILMYGLKDAEGNVLTPARYTSILPFSDGLAAVILDGGGDDFTAPGGCSPAGRLGFVNAEGSEVISPQFGDCIVYYLGGNYYTEGGHGMFAEGMAAVVVDSLFGFIDSEGSVVISGKYDYAEPFHDGLAMVRRDDKAGFINHEGHEVIPVQYEKAEYFCDGIAPVQVDGKLGFIDTEGNEVIPPIFDTEINVDWDYHWITGEMYSEGLIRVKLNGELGYADLHGGCTFRSLDYRIPSSTK